MIEEGGYDAIVAFLTMVAASPYIVDDLLARLGALRARHPERLIVLSLIAPPDIVARYEAAGYLVFEDPCRAVAAVAALAGFGASFARPPEAPPPSSLPAPLPPLPEGPLSERTAKALLAAAGIPVLEERLAGDAEDAAQAARELGLPVALKLSAPGLAHKTEIGGVLLNVATPEAARDGYETLVARAEVAGVAPEGVLVAPMAAAGVETILGVQRDPLFGPAVMFGLGGVLVEVLGDVAFRLAPFGLDEAHRMIREIKGFKLLQGVRGAPPADLEALAEALVRLSVLAAAEAERIESIDVNPFLVLPEGQGAVALDALIVLRVGSEAP
jgi:acyl-CoA synthetase (NDP forming)